MGEMTSIQFDAAAASATGLRPALAAALAYLAGPFSGAIILLAEGTNRYVRFHAWQAIIGLGALGLLALILLLSAFLGLFLSPTLFRTLFVAAGLTAGAWVVVWGICVVKAVNGAVWKLPLAGNLAARCAERRGPGAKTSRGELRREG